MAEPPPERSWWTTLPGLLTGLAALLTAMTGLLALLLPVYQARVALAPTDPAGRAAVPAAAPVPAPSPPREARPAGPEPRLAPQPDPRVPAGGSEPGKAAPPLVLGERLEIAGTWFEVLALGNAALRDGTREISVTFRVTAGTTQVDLSRSNVRILTPGRIHRPVEGLPLTAVPAGAARQLWVRFEVPEPLGDAYLSFTDDAFAPRGEARRALPGR
ncbi:hypothetical protein ACFQS7_00425 [Dankookia sp. GCM10030260]|uniref:hypothetical protein n=1 Tax=Dankookia sp. GCM10030260 TaxID=3273390 RepID=UPI00361314BE